MKMSRREICELLADRVVEAMTQQELEEFVFDGVYDSFMLDSTMQELEEHALAYGLLEDDETLEII
jgi:hypothetical protein